MDSYRFIDLIREVLSATKKPMSGEQIWEEASRLGLAEKVGSRGKTPWNTIQSQLYVDIRDNTNSEFVQVSKHPALFGLKALRYEEFEVEAAEENINSDVDVSVSSSSQAKWNERDLHPLLTKYVDSDPHFMCRTKTIFQEHSTKGAKNADKWTHPDIVGVYYPFDDYEKSTVRLQETLRVSSFKLFSFELKKQLKTGNLRECFFQAVSNSSWANEGYLVAPKISNDSDFLADLQRLSNAFGIGVIRLDIKHIEQSEIIFQAQVRDNLDWPTVDRLAGMNPDFREFMEDICNSEKIKKSTGFYDDVLKDAEYEEYLEEHGML